MVSPLWTPGRVRGERLLGAERIGLVQHDNLRLVDKLVTVSFDLGAHRLVSLASILAGAIDQMQKHAAAFDVAEKTVAKTHALMSAFDQARNIGEYEFAA